MSRKETIISYMENIYKLKPKGKKPFRADLMRLARENGNGKIRRRVRAVRRGRSPRAPGGCEGDAGFGFRLAAAQTAGIHRPAGSLRRTLCQSGGRSCPAQPGKEKIQTIIPETPEKFPRLLDRNA